MEVKSPPNPVETLSCEQTIGYFFQNKLLLVEALQTVPTALSLGNRQRFQDGNKRLALVGDSVLTLLVAAEWYSTWGTESVFESVRAEVVSESSLDAAGSRNEIHRSMNWHVEKPSELPEMRAALDTTIKAIIGAAYLDGGIDAANKVVRRLGIDIRGGAN